MTTVYEEKGVPFVLRVLWFFLVGWHVSLYWIVIAWLLNLTIVGLPLGIWMLHRVPLVLTLRMPREYNVATVRDGGRVDRQVQSRPQRPWPVRLVYFLLVGWWASLLWSLAGWLLCVSIVGLPLGVLMLNRIPEVTTLMRH